MCRRLHRNQAAPGWSLTSTDMIQRSVVAGLTLLLAGGCGAGPDFPAEFSHDELGYEILASQVINRDEELGTPSYLVSIGEYVVISDYPSRGSAIHLIRAKDGERVLSFGRDGDGPGEFRGPPALIRAPGLDDALWAYSAGSARLTLFTLNDVLAGEFGGTRHRQLSGPYVMYRLAMLDDTHAAGIGNFADGRVAVVDVVTGETRLGGTVPLDDESGPPYVRQQAYQGFIAARPSGEQFVIATWRGSQLEIYDRQGGLQKKFDGPYPFIPDFNVIEGPSGRLISQAGMKNRYGYVDITATEEHIIALFSGRAEASYGGSASVAEYVHLFDWDGAFVKAFKLDRPVIALAANHNGQVLFALAEDPEPIVLRIPLRN